MARDGSGGYDLPSDPIENGQVNDADPVQANFDDIATAIEGSLARDGQGGMTGNLAMGTNRIVNVGDATVGTDGPSMRQVQLGSLVYCADDSVADTQYLLNVTPAFGALVNGITVRFTAQLTNAATPTIRLSGLTAQAFTYKNGVVLPAGAIVAGDLVEVTYNGGFRLPYDPPYFWQQTSTTSFGAVATGTTLIPWDDTIPQNTEGDEYMTLSIVPRRTTNKLKIRVVFNYSYSVSTQVTVALFQDSTAAALAAASNVGNGDPSQIVLEHVMVAGGVAGVSIAFKVRAGGDDAGTLTFNGAGGGRKLGGVNASRITIEDVSP